jgi:hypothetical protein
MEMKAILLGTLKNPQTIEDGICPNYVSSPHSLPTSIFRTTVLGKITIDELNSELEFFRFCSMGKKCYQTSCQYSDKGYRRTNEVTSFFQSNQSIDEFLENLFQSIDIRKESKCYSYKGIDGKTSGVYREISKNDVVLRRVNDQKIKVKILYTCNMRDNCYQDSCVWSHSSYLDSQNEKLMKKIAPYATLEGL